MSDHTRKRQPLLGKYVDWLKKNIALSHQHCSSDKGSENVLAVANAGHSVFAIGRAGVGKTFPQ